MNARQTVNVGICLIGLVSTRWQMNLCQYTIWWLWLDAQTSFESWWANLLCHFVPNQRHNSILFFTFIIFPLLFMILSEQTCDPFSQHKSRTTSLRSTWNQIWPWLLNVPGLIVNDSLFQRNTKCLISVSSVLVLGSLSCFHVFLFRCLLSMHYSCFYCSFVWLWCCNPLSVSLVLSSQEKSSSHLCSSYVLSQV